MITEVGVGISLGRFFEGLPSSVSFDVIMQSMSNQRRDTVVSWPSDLLTYWRLYTSSVW